MIYKLNNVDITTYGLIPAQQPNSNIAIAGNFDMPIRIGKTYHEWEEGIEPYVAKNELFFGGIDIKLRCVLKDENLFAKFLAFVGEINGFSELVDFETGFGTYRVYVKDEVQIERIAKNIAYVTITFRCPVIDIPTATLPSTGSSNFSLDDIPFTEFGFEVLKHRVVLLRPSSINFQSTVYGREAYKVNKFGLATINVPLVIRAQANEFTAKMNRLKHALSREGVRKLTLTGQNLRTFCKDGMSVNKIYKQGNEIIAMLTIPFIYLGQAAELAYLFDGNNQLTDNSLKLKGAK